MATNKITVSIIGAGGRGMDCYARLMQEHFSQQVSIVAVAEPDEERRKLFAQRFGISPANSFASWQKILQQPRVSDALVIATQDKMHFEPFQAAVKKGYHILLEKPMSNNKEECLKMMAIAKGYPQQIILVCHVLRYTVFFLKIKALLDAGQIGEVQAVQHNENIGYWHFAHSFARGNWSVKSLSGPLTLTKSCHDFDILVWLLGSPVKRVSAFGTLRHFNREHAPTGATEFCYNCPLSQSCAYCAQTIYSRMTLTAVNAHRSPDEVEEFLKVSNYGRCVYQLENDVPESIAMSLEFASGVVATFLLSAFTQKVTRTIKILGSNGELRGDIHKNEIEVLHFDMSTAKMSLGDPTNDAHAGGDTGIICDFVELLLGRKTEKLSDISASINSHLAAFAAEASRLNQGMPVELPL